MYCARNLEDAMAAPEETAELYLVGQGYGAFPMEVLQMPQLRLLDLSQNQIATLPAELGLLTQLEVLILRANAIRQIPPEIGQLQRLQRLDVEKNQLNALPAELRYCEGLRELRLSYNSFETWPTEALTTQLNSLTISRNQLHALPDSLRHLHHLSYLDVSFNALHTLPSGLILIESLEHLMLEGNPLRLALPSTDPEHDLERLFQELKRGKGSANERQRWFRLVQGDATLLADAAPHQLAAMLDSVLPQVRAAAKELLPIWFPSPLPTAGPAEIVFAGNITGKSKYQKSLQAAGFQVLNRPTANAILVLGDRPGAMAQQAFAQGNPIAYEGHLVGWLKAAQGEFLSSGAQVNPMTESLRRLIRSYRKENIEIALVMMSKAGIPPALLTELLAIQLFHSDPEIKAKAAAAFAQLADKQVRAFVERQIAQYFKAELLEKVPALVEALLRNKALDAPTLVDAAIDLAQGSLGLVLLLPEKDRLPHFQKFLKEGQLNLSNLHLATLPEALAQVRDLRYLMLSRNQLTELPSDLAPFAALEMLDLAENQLIQVPESVGILRRLTGLDVSQNRLRNLPDSIAEMTSLEALRLDRNPLVGLPDALADLPQLEMLGLYGCKFAHFPAVVWRLRGLRSLDVGECNLRELPDTIGGFPHLESLAMRDNPLGHLPEWIGEMPALRFLDLSLLPARMLPTSLHGHARVERIYLIRDESMDWEQVLPILASMPRLRYVYLRGRKIVRNIQLLIEDKLPRVRVIWNG